MDGFYLYYKSFFLQPTTTLYHNSFGEKQLLTIIHRENIAKLLPRWQTLFTGRLFFYFRWMQVDLIELASYNISYVARSLGKLASYLQLTVCVQTCEFLSRSRLLFPVPFWPVLVMSYRFRQSISSCFLFSFFAEKILVCVHWISYNNVGNKKQTGMMIKPCRLFFSSAFPALAWTQSACLWTGRGLIRL